MLPPQLPTGLARARANLRPPWKPGQSGNSHGAGHPALTLAAEIRRRTHGGRDAVEFLEQVVSGRPMPVPGGRAQRPSLDQRLKALIILLERGWGHVREVIEFQGDAVSSAAERVAMLRRLSADDREQLRAILARAAAPDGGREGELRAPERPQARPEEPPPDAAS